MTRSRALPLKPERDASQSSDVGSIRLGEATAAAQQAPYSLEHDLECTIIMAIKQSGHL